MIKHVKSRMLRMLSVSKRKLVNGIALVTSQRNISGKHWSMSSGDVLRFVHLNYLGRTALEEFMIGS